MKRVLVILTMLSSLLFMSFNLYSQKKSKINCKYIQNKVDEFSKSRVVQTEGKIVFDEKVFAPGGVTQFLLDSYRLCFNVYGYNINGTNSLKIDYTAYNAPSGFIEAFNKIEFLLENGDVISFNLDGDCKFNVNNDWYHYWNIYPIKDDAEWLKLKTIPLKKVRVYQTDNRQRTMEIKKKNSQEIMDIIYCIDILDIPKNEQLSTNINIGNTNIHFPSYFPIDSSTLKIAYKGAITIENKNKSQLFQGTKEWFAKNFSPYNYNNGLTSGSFNAGITYQDTTIGKIIGTGIIDVHFKKSDGSEISGGIVSYNVTIMVKDNKYKYEITGFIHKGYRSTGIHDLGSIEDWKENEHQSFPKQEQIQSYWDQVNDKILKLISSLNASLKQESNDGKW